MPIYEFYCPECNTIFSFFSRKATADKTPECPKCAGKLKREISSFSVSSSRADSSEQMPQFDESRMERAVNAMAAQAGNIDENDPKAATEMMRKFSDMAGLKLGKDMEEALSRIESGEDPESVEKDLDLNEDSLFADAGASGAGGEHGAAHRSFPKRDDKLYDM